MKNLLRLKPVIKVRFGCVSFTLNENQRRLLLPVLNFSTFRSKSQFFFFERHNTHFTMCCTRFARTTLLVLDRCVHRLLSTALVLVFATQRSILNADSSMHHAFRKLGTTISNDYISTKIIGVYVSALPSIML